MQISNENLERLKKAIACPFNFQCIENEDFDIQEIMLINENDYVDCDTDKHRNSCGKTIPSPFSAICNCPVKIYLNKTLMV